MKTSIRNNSLIICATLCITSFFTTLKVTAQCSATPGSLGGSGNFCDGDQLNIGIPITKKSQTYTWYLNSSKVVKGPVSGNGSDLSYNALAGSSTAGHYTVRTDKEGCTSTEFGDVTVVYIGAPTGLAKTAVYFDSVSFKWNKLQQQISGYLYAVDADSLSSSPGTFTTDTSATVHGLAPFTTYYFHVKAISDGGGDCAWATVKFTTNISKGDGSVDRSFNGNGKVITNIGQYCKAFAEAIQPDGKILVAGSSYNSNEDFTIVRYNTDGTIDKSFGNKGKAIIDLGESEHINAIAVQPNGKIIVTGGPIGISNSKIELIRYNSNGKIDAGFGSGGIVFTDVIPAGFNVAQAIAIQPDGNIIVAGNAYNGVTEDIILVRYRANGSLDPGFGTGGMVITDLGADESATCMALQTDGRILVGGYGSYGDYTANDFLTVRYTKNGVLDHHFGDGGAVFTDFSGNPDFASSIAVLPNGKFLLCGTTNPYYTEIALAKYKPDGSPETGFDLDGKAVYSDTYSSFTAQSVLLPVNGKIIVVGSAYNGTSDDILLLRLLLNGTVDSTFGYNGIILTDFDAREDRASAANLQSNGKLVISGITRDNFGYPEICVARYNLDSASTTLSATNASVKKQPGNPVSKILLAPNPVKDMLHVTGLQPAMSKTIFIMDITGREVQRFITSANSYICNVHRLPAGTYYLCVEENKKRSYLKFIKE